MPKMPTRESRIASMLKVVMSSTEAAEARRGLVPDGESGQAGGLMAFPIEFAWRHSTPSVTNHSEREQNSLPPNCTISPISIFRMNTSMKIRL